jgi:hypothetical protein
MSIITFDDLPPRERRLVWWSIAWRGFVISGCGAVGGGVAGCVIGFIVASISPAFGHNVREPGVMLLIKTLGGIAGFVVGLALSWPYVRWLFRARLGGFKLLLVRDPERAAV